MSPRPLAAVVLLALAAPVLVSCQQKMAREGRVRPYEESRFFPDGSSARQPVAGTVAYGRSVGKAEPPAQSADQEAFATGRKGAAWITELPVPVTRQLLERGQQRYNIFCAPCHSLTGDGQGIIVQRGFTAPPSYHIDRLRAAPAGHFFDVITHGYGAMFSYADRVPITDRWAIVAYIRALQRSQSSRFSELPAELQARIRSSAKEGDQ